MVRSAASTVTHKHKLAKSQRKSAKENGNLRASLPESLLRKQELDTSSHRPRTSVASASSAVFARIPRKKSRISLTTSNVTKYHEDSESDSDAAENDPLVTEGCTKKDSRQLSLSTGDEESLTSSDQSWLDGTTLIAQYTAEDLDTPEERALALAEYLQVPFQEKGVELKKDLCNALMTTLNEIRLAHLSLDQGPDIDRAKGIVHFTDICDKRHADMIRLHANFSEGDGEKQMEINELFAQLKQAYDARTGLRNEFKACIEDLTSKQAAIANQLESDMSAAIQQLEKKYKKNDSTKSKERLLREALAKV